MPDATPKPAPKKRGRPRKTPAKSDVGPKALEVTGPKPPACKDCSHCLRPKDSSLLQCTKFPAWLTVGPDHYCSYFVRGE